MKPTRTRRLLAWIAACACLFSLPYQCETRQQAQRRFMRRVSAVKAEKARLCRIKAVEAEAAGDPKRARMLRDAARRFDELSGREDPDR